MMKPPEKIKKVHRGLGRGLSTLLGDLEAKTVLEEFPTSSQKTGKENNVYDNNSSQLDTSFLKNIPIEWINPGPWQPRRKFDIKSLEELADSFLKQGIIQPILIRSVDGEKNKYQLIAGERRWRAAQIAKIHEIPCIIKDFTKQEAAEIALVENIQRTDLTPIEEAIAYQQLINIFGYTQQELSTAIGKSRPYIANLLRLLTLPEWIQFEIENGTVSVGQIRPIIGLKDVDKLARLILKQNLTARQVENLIKSQVNVTKKLNFKNANTNIENQKLEEKIEQQLGLKVDILWSSKTEKGSIKLSVSSLEQFDMVLDRLGV